MLQPWMMWALGGALVSVVAVIAALIVYVARSTVDANGETLEP